MTVRKSRHGGNAILRARLRSPAVTGADDQVWAQGGPFRVRALLIDQPREAAYGIGGGKLFEKLPAGERPNVHVASVTKCMTLLLAVELLETPGAGVDLDDPVPVSALAAGTGGSHVEPPYGEVLEEGDEMPLDLLLYGMMLRSCNKSSVAVAEYLGRKQWLWSHGSLPANFDACGHFVTMMQSKADELMMGNTICGHPAGGMITTPPKTWRTSGIKPGNIRNSAASRPIRTSRCAGFTTPWRSAP